MRLVALLAWLILTSTCAEARVGPSSLGRFPSPSLVPSTVINFFCLSPIFLVRASEDRRCQLPRFAFVLFRQKHYRGLGSSAEIRN